MAEIQKDGCEGISALDRGSNKAETRGVSKKSRPGTKIHEFSSTPEKERANPASSAVEAITVRRQPRYSPSTVR